MSEIIPFIKKDNLPSGTDLKKLDPRTRRRIKVLLRKGFGEYLEEVERDLDEDYVINCTADCFDSVNLKNLKSHPQRARRR